MDIIADKNFSVFSKLARRLGSDLPDYVANYTPDQEKIASELSDEAFACPAKREYPVDSKATTWMSALYAANSIKEAGKEAVAAKDALPVIKQAAITWGIEDDIASVLENSETVVKKAAADSDDSNYGWIDRDENGKVVSRRYGIFDKAGVMKAAEYFLANRDHYHYKTKEKIAKFILKKAQEHEVNPAVLGSEIEKEAGYGIPLKSVIMDELNERALLAKHAECGQLLSNVNNILEVCEPEEFPEAAEKIAELVNEFDIAEDLTEHYGKRITRPAEFMYSVSFKEAEAACENIVSIGGRSYDVEKLAENVPANEFYLVLGPKVAASITDSGEYDEDSEGLHKAAASKLRSVLPGLSQAQQRELDRHLVSLCD